jgi:hypothetical protein
MSMKKRVRIEPTERLREGSSPLKGFDPVIGWLVCTRGRERGRSYELHGGQRGEIVLGRDPQWDVFLQDESITRKRAAKITFDGRDSSFAVTSIDDDVTLFSAVPTAPQPDRGSGDWRIIGSNSGSQGDSSVGVRVRTDHPLKPRDEIEIGEARLMFIPLEFDWYRRIDQP